MHCCNHWWSALLQAEVDFGAEIKDPFVLFAGVLCLHVWLFGRWMVRYIMI